MRIEKRVVEAICGIHPNTLRRWKKRYPGCLEFKLKDNSIEFDVENLISWFEKHNRMQAEKIRNYIAANKHRVM